MKKEVRNMLIMLGIGVVVVVLGITYLTSTYAGPPTEEGLRVSLAESKAAFDSGDGVIVDVRNQEEFDKLRIPGSLLMPINDMEGNEPDVPLDTNIYLYCT